MGSAPPSSELRYPFDGSLILRHAKRLKREAMDRTDLVPLRLAILGGWTTQETAQLLEIFLPSQGLRPDLYQSEYNQFFEEAVLHTKRLEAFRPQIVYLHTATHNLRSIPSVSASKDEFEGCVRAELARFDEIWRTLHAKLKCTVVQNNFELPLDPLGNFGGTAYGGQRHFVNRLNLELAERARQNKYLLIHDVNALAARLGVERWFDARRWFAYKIRVTPDANAALAHSLSMLLAAALGRAKKCLVLDLDNTLWGGVIGDDGVDKIRLGRETAEAEAYTAFQQFCDELQKRGVLLAVCSKNEEETAKQGLAHPDSVLTLNKFSAFRANWAPKPINIASIAKELNIGLDSLVFVDDNPAERELVRAQLPMVAVPEVGADVSRYAEILAAAGYFETVGLSAEDLARSQLYGTGVARTDLQAKYRSYDEYLAALDMKAEISEFRPLYLDRIVQLINKTNQFNLTTRRYTSADVDAVLADANAIPLYGRLSDRFGDNGLISVIIGRRQGKRVNIDLWLMSCRVLERQVEFAMLDALVERALAAGATQLYGTYLRTEKNAMVADLYEQLGFSCESRASDGSRSEWSLNIEAGRQNENRHILVTGAVAR